MASGIEYLKYTMRKNGKTKTPSPTGRVFRLPHLQALRLAVHGFRRIDRFAFPVLDLFERHRVQTREFLTEKSRRGRGSRTQCLKTLGVLVRQFLSESHNKA